MIFLNFLNIRKDYNKPQQYPLKPPTENVPVSFRENVSFLWRHFFTNIFKNKEVFWEFQNK